jgi:hypothetical protein
MNQVNEEMRAYRKGTRRQQALQRSSTPWGFALLGRGPPSSEIYLLILIEIY